MVLFLSALVILCAAVLTTAHPASLICNDPRLKEGGNMMHSFVTINNHQSDLRLEANAMQYKYGKSIRITITANGTRFVKQDAPMGVYLGLQVSFTGPNGEAMGYFHDASPDLDYTPGCSSSVFSKTGSSFAGKSFVSWTPHNDGYVRTRGNATFQLVFSNGPGGGDLTALGYGIKIPNPYMYLTTIDLWDPEKWNPTPPAVNPPSAPGSKDKCVVNAPPTPGWPAHSYKRSSVFVQHLPEGSQTFASGKCLPCRVDHRDRCLSAMVTCPSAPGQPVLQSLWRHARRCQGTPDLVHAVPHTPGVRAGHTICPEPQYYSTLHPNILDLERFVPKLQRDYPLDFPDSDTATRAIAEYRRMLSLVQRFPADPIVPSPLVDRVWHAHILDTERYRRDSLRLFGFYLHHAPSFGGGEEKAELRQQQRRMLQNYEKTFDAAPPQSMWGSGNTEKDPDCCSAKCVKPNCNSCVGCNAVYCGFMDADTHALDNHTGLILDGAHATRTTLAPEQFAGYVPLRPTSGAETTSSDTEATYACHIEPMKDMALSWSVSGHYIYFRHSIAADAWYGVGLNNVSGMGLADYMVTMPHNNYTGVKDMFMYTDGNGYPCWDVLHECSVGNTTKGTKDVEDEQITQGAGVTTSTWNRKLVTGDYKDRAIVKGNLTVLFARGTDNFFNFHGEMAAECVIDFFTGAYNCA